jgi:hypothetical protein
VPAPSPTPALAPAPPSLASKPFLVNDNTDLQSIPPGSGKAAKKARRRARKRASRLEANRAAEEVVRRAAEMAQVSSEQIAREKERLARELYEKIREEASESARKKNELYVKKKKKQERRVLRLARFKASQQVSSAVALDTDGAAGGESGGQVRGGKKATRAIEYLPGPDEIGYDDAVAEAKSAQGKAIVGGGPTAGSKKRKSELVSEPENDIAVTGHKRRKLDHTLGAIEQSTPGGDDGRDVDISETSDPESEESYDPIADLPEHTYDSDSLNCLPDEILTRVVGYCDPMTRTLLGLTSKRFGRVAVAHEAAFPDVRDRYGLDLERFRFMALLEGWMNPVWSAVVGAVLTGGQVTNSKTEDTADGAMVVASPAKTRSKPLITPMPSVVHLDHLKTMRCCYICRMYLPISGGKCKSWKNCPKKAEMPIEQSTVKARADEIKRRIYEISSYPSERTRIQVKQGGKPLPQIKEERPEPQEYTWEAEDWTTLSIGVMRSRARLPDVKHICPKCIFTVHTVHLGWPPETPIDRWMAEDNPAAWGVGYRALPLGRELQYSDDDETLQKRRTQVAQCENPNVLVGSAAGYNDGLEASEHDGEGEASMDESNG